MLITLFLLLAASANGFRLNPANYYSSYGQPYGGYGNAIPNYEYRGYDRYPKVCDSVYDYNPTLLNWHTAARFCQSMMGQLAVVTSKVQNDYLDERFGSLSSKGLWLGASDRRREGFWEWADGRVMYFTNWYRNQPNNYPRDSNCLLMRGKDGFWDDIDCSKLKPSLCEYKVCAYPMVDNATLNSTADSTDDATPDILDLDQPSFTPLVDLLKANLPKIKFNVTSHENDTITTDSDNSTIVTAPNKLGTVNNLDIVQMPIPRYSGDASTDDKSQVKAKTDGSDKEASKTDEKAIKDAEGTPKPIVVEFEEGDDAPINVDVSEDAAEHERSEQTDEQEQTDDEQEQTDDEQEQTDDEQEPADDEGDLEPADDELTTPEPENADDSKDKDHPLGTSTILSVLLRLLEHTQRLRRPCTAFPHTNGDWVCNRPNLPWLCILNCHGRPISGDGFVSEQGVHVGEGVIVCDDGAWSRTDYFCA